MSLLRFSVEEAGGLLYTSSMLFFFGAIMILYVRGKIDLVEMFTKTDVKGEVRTDRRKVMEFGTWYALMMTLWYLTVNDRLTEWFLISFVAVGGGVAWLRDKKELASREQAARFGGGSDDAAP